MEPEATTLNVLSHCVVGILVTNLINYYFSTMGEVYSVILCHRRLCEAYVVPMGIEPRTHTNSYTIEQGVKLIFTKGLHQQYSSP